MFLSSTNKARMATWPPSHNKSSLCSTMWPVEHFLRRRPTLGRSSMIQTKDHKVRLTSGNLEHQGAHHLLGGNHTQAMVLREVDSLSLQESWSKEHHPVGIGLAGFWINCPKIYNRKETNGNCKVWCQRHSWLQMDLQVPEDMEHVLNLRIDTKKTQHFLSHNPMVLTCQHRFNFRESIIRSIAGIKLKIKLISAN